VAVVRADRYGLAAGAVLHAGILLFVFERIGAAVRPGDALVEPQAEAVGAPPARLAEARLVDDAVVVPSVGPAMLESGVGGDRLQQIDRAEAVLRGELIPETIIASR